MAINVIRGFYGLALVSGLYFGIKEGILASPLSNSANIIPENSKGKEGYHEYANRMAKELGVNKKITVIKGDSFGHYGNNLLSTQAGVQILLNKEMPDAMIRHMIIHDIAHVKFSDILTWTFIPLIISIFASFALNCRFPMAACLVGLATGMISFAAIHKWREKHACLTAIKHSSAETNKTVLKFLKNAEQKRIKEEFGFSLSRRFVNYILNIPNLSFNEMISYYKNHLGIKV